MIWRALRPFIYFTVLIVGSLCFLYLFDKLGGGGEYAQSLEAEVHKLRCQVQDKTPECVALNAAYAKGRK